MVRVRQKGENYLIQNMIVTSIAIDIPAKYI